MATLLELGPLGQMTCTRSYAVTTLCFSTPDDETQKRAVETLQNAAEKLTSLIPWIAGQVVTEGRDAIHSGTHRIVDYPRHNGRGRFLKVKDLREEPGIAAYNDIIAQNAPMSMIPPSGLICPEFGFGSDYPIDEEMPVLSYQANLLVGGILLTICGQHNAVDGNGNAKIIHHFAKICRGEELSEDEIREANRDREEVIPPYEPTEAWDPWDKIRCPSNLGDTVGSWPPKHGDSRWRVFSFSPESMAELKKMTKDAGATSAPGVKYVSTNDIATALIWRHLVRIRGLDSNTSTTSCWRACNGRPRASPPMSPNHLGHTIMCCGTAIPYSDLFNKSLAEIASALRQTLNEDITSHGFQSMIHLLRETKDRTTINYGAGMGASDMMITSHVAHDLYNANFGSESGLGKGLPDVIRRPDLPGGQGIPWMLPQRRDGGVDVMLNLLDDDVKKLSEGQDGEEWTRFVQYIG